jgi:uncharacterized repeat protein (TIGR01451 family)
LPADLTIQKAGPAMVKNGDAVVYTLTLRNAGPGPADGASYLDALPAGLTGVTAVCGAASTGTSCGTVVVSGTSVSGTLTTLPSGGAATVTITATAPASGSTALVNTATITAPAGVTDPVPANNSSTVTTKVVPVMPKQADVSLTKTTANTVAPNGTLTYLLTVVNAGPGAANGAVLSDVVPAQLTSVSAVCVSATAGASCTAPVLAGNTVTATMATLPANASVQYRVTGTAPSTVGTIITNMANVALSADITDTNMANNQSTATTTVSSAPVVQANLSLVKTGSTSVAADGQVTYSLVVTNAGPAAANGTQISDVLPAELSNIAAVCSNATGGASCSAANVSGFTMTATVSTLPANSSVTYTVTARAPSLPTRLTNTAQLILPPGVVDPSPEDNLGGPVITQVSALGAIKGTVYKDLNRNGKQDANEPGVAGVIVTVRSPSGAVLATTTSDANGVYTFANLPSGSGYTVSFGYGTNPQGMTNPAGTQQDPLSGNSNGLQTITGITVLDDNVTFNQNARIVDPSGVVYDSVSRKPVAGAKVCLFANGALVLDTQLIAATPNCQTTDATGAYSFFINGTAPTGTYSLQVTQPTGYLAPNAVQGGVPLPTVGGVCAIPAAPGMVMVQPQSTAPAVGVNAGAAQYCLQITGFGPSAQDVIHNHIPLDPMATAKLLVSKTAAKASAEIGDSMTYTITVRRIDTSAGILSNFVVIDTLPAGFTYVSGTATVNTASVTDASIGLAAQGSKPVMAIALNTPLAANQQVVLTYRVRVGVGAAEGSGINRAIAKYTENTDCAVEPNKCSNEARATVKVTAGVFTTQACVIGKVYADCNKNGIQDNEELGIPGVKLYLLDGTQIITDVEGKYSLCDLKPQTGVLAVDRKTMPRGAIFGTTSNRNALDGSSLFIDLKKGELHRADFTEASCSNPVMEQIKARRAQGEVRAAESETDKSAVGTGNRGLKYQDKPSGSPIEATDSANQPSIKVRQ